MRKLWTARAIVGWMEGCAVAKMCSVYQELEEVSDR